MPVVPILPVEAPRDEVSSVPTLLKQRSKFFHHIYKFFITYLL